jgi:hypothetical protein
MAADLQTKTPESVTYQSTSNYHNDYVVIVSLQAGKLPDRLHSRDPGADLPGTEATF